MRLLDEPKRKSSKIKHNISSPRITFISRLCLPRAMFIRHHYKLTANERSNEKSRVKGIFQQNGRVRGDAQCGASSMRICQGEEKEGVWR